MGSQSIEYGRITWTNIIHATPDDITHLHRQYPQFHPLDLEDCLSRIERPKIDEYDAYLFIVMHFPIWDHIGRISRPSEVDFFVGSGFLVTVHDGELKALGSFFADLEEDESKRDKYMVNGAGALLHSIVDRLVDNIFPMLYKLDGNIRQIEENLFSEDSRQVIQDISIMRRDITVLRRILRPQVAILANLEQVDRVYIREDLDNYFGDILDHLQKACDIVDEHAEVIVSLADTSSALASHRINEVIRILTVISVIMLPLTLISGIMGMNISVPFENQPAAFVSVIALMAVVSIVMLGAFKAKGWL